MYLDRQDFFGEEEGNKDVEVVAKECGQAP